MVSSDQRPVVTSRRTVLTAAVAAAGAAVAGRIIGPDTARAADGGNLILGQANEAASLTSLGVTTDSSAFQVAGTVTNNLVEVSNGGTGTGLAAQGLSGPGMLAITQTGAWAGGAISAQGTIGIAGGASTGIDELAPSYVGETGVFGVGKVTETSNSTGVWGEGDVGVFGYGSYGVWGQGFNGVRGQADAIPGAIGVVAAAPSTSQYALLASGKVKLSRSGRTYVSSGTSSRKVTLAGVTSATHVMASLGTNRAGVYIQAVVPITGAFTVYLNKTVPGTTYVHWVVLDA
jgi:hypothetical protein